MTEFFCWLSKNPTFPLITISAIIAFFSYRTQVKLAKIKHSIDFQDGYHDSEELGLALKEVKKFFHLTEEELLKQLSTTNNDSLVVVLNIWERASIAIKKKIYDEDEVFK